MRAVVVFGWGEFHFGFRTHFETLLDCRRVWKVEKGDNPSERGGENLHATRVRRPFSTPTPHKSTRANICADAATAAREAPLPPLLRIKKRRGGSAVAEHLAVFMGAFFQNSTRIFIRGS